MILLVISYVKLIIINPKYLFYYTTTQEIVPDKNQLKKHLIKSSIPERFHFYYIIKSVGSCDS